MARRFPDDEAPAWLECPHCGDVAIYSDPDGMFLDGDGGECVSCGMPGWVTADAETDAEWHMSDDVGDKCNRDGCEECAEQ